MCASADKLQQCANMGDHTSLCDAPVAVLAVLIERLMSHWTQRVPALSEATLRLARDHYQVGNTHTNTRTHTHTHTQAHRSLAWC